MVIFLVLTVIMMLAILAGSILISTAIIVQITNAKKAEPEKKSAKKLYIWAFGFWGLAILTLIPLIGFATVTH